MNRSQISYSLLLLFVGMSCGKQQPIAPVEVHTYPKVFTLVNSRTMPLQVDMYLSASDRGNQVNLKYSCVVPDGGHYNVPLSKIDTLAKYYYDIHTLDYMYSNWGEGDALTVFMGYGGSFDLRSDNLTAARWYFIRGNEPSTSWKAIDKHFEGEPSIWSQLNDTAKYMRLVLNRDMTGYVSQKRFDNATVTDTIRIVQTAIWDGGIIQLSLDNALSPKRYNLYNTTVEPDYNSGHTISSDTILLRDYVYYWVMVKE